MSMYVPYMVLKKESQAKVNIDSGLKDELAKWLETEQAGVSAASNTASKKFFICV